MEKNEEIPDYVIWLDKLNHYKTIITENPDHFRIEKQILDRSFSILKEKISIAIIGPGNSGKSKFLNALIREEFLQTDDLYCTSFGLKINTSVKTSLFEYEKKNPEIISEKEQIKNTIKKINSEEQNKRKKELLEEKRYHGSPIWVLETPIFAFQRNSINKEIKNFYNFIELLDFPGIGKQNCFFGQGEPLNSLLNQCVLRKADNDEIGSAFNDLIKKINLDILIVLLDLTNITNLKEFFKLFNKKLFISGNRAQFKNIVEKRNIIFVVNKADEMIERDNDEIRKKKEELIRNSIFCYFFKCVEKNLQDLNKLKNEFPVYFVSGLKAFDSVIFTEYKYRDQLKKKNLTNDRIVDLVNRQKNKILNNNEYDTESNFNPMLLELCKKISYIYDKKINNEMYKNLSFIEEGKSNFINKFPHLFDKNNFLIKNSKNIDEKIQEIQKNLTKKHKILLSSLNRAVENLVEKNKNIISEEYYSFVNNIKSLISNANEEGLNYLKTFTSEVSQLFNELEKFKLFLKLKINFNLNEVLNNIENKNDYFLYDFLPDNINYHRYWLFNYILQIVNKITFEKKWKKFLNISKGNTKKLLINLQNNFDSNYININEIIMDSFNLIKKVNNIA